MIRRLFRLIVKLGIIAGVGIGIALVVKKLTAAPEPPAPLEPWPPLDPEPIPEPSPSPLDVADGPSDLVDEALEAAVADANGGGAEGDGSAPD